MNKYLSVITNFGCHYSCPYCIVKNNNLQIPKSTIDGLNSLKKAIELTDCNWISVSGGGDPVWDYENHTDWWDDFFKKTWMKCIELHTSIINDSMFPYYRFKRVVYHLHNFEQLKQIIRIGQQIVRVVFVVTEDFREELINKIAVFCRNSDQIDELSFRQMVDNNYESTDYCKDYLKSGHQKSWWYIEQCDYNLYYCENKIYTEYRRIGE